MKFNILILAVLSLSFSLSNDSLNGDDNKEDIYRNERIFQILNLQIPSNLQEKLPNSNVTWEKMIDIVECMKRHEKPFDLKKIIAKTLEQNHLSNYSKLLVIKSLKVISEKNLQTEIQEFESFFDDFSSFEGFIF